MEMGLLRMPRHGFLDRVCMCQAPQVPAKQRGWGAFLHSYRRLSKLPSGFDFPFMNLDLGGSFFFHIT